MVRRSQSRELVGGVSLVNEIDGVGDGDEVRKRMENREGEKLSWERSGGGMVSM